MSAVFTLNPPFLQKIEAPSCAWNARSESILDKLKAIPVSEGGMRRKGTQCDSIGLWTTYLAHDNAYAEFPSKCEPGAKLPFRSKKLKERYPDLEAW